jgi:hypothetical protein
MKRQIMDDATQEDCKTKRAKQVKNQEITLLSSIEQIAISVLCCGTGVIAQNMLC